MALPKGYQASGSIDVHFLVVRSNFFIFTTNSFEVQTLRFTLYYFRKPVSLRNLQPVFDC